MSQLDIQAFPKTFQMIYLVNPSKNIGIELNVLTHDFDFSNADIWETPLDECTLQLKHIGEYQRFNENLIKQFQNVFRKIVSSLFKQLEEVYCEMCFHIPVN